MPHTAYDDDELGLSPGWDEHLDPNIRKDIRQARVVARENADLKAQLATFERERLLARAGIPSDRRGEVFAREYDGPVDDPEKIKAAYVELFGPLAAPGEGEGNEPDPAAGDRRIAEAAAAGTSQGTPGSIDLADAIKLAKTPEEVKELIRQAASMTTWQPGQMIPRLPDDS